MAPVEVMSLEVVPLEAMMLHGSTAVTALETTVPHGSTAATALETVTASPLRLAGRADGEHHCQRGERYDYDSFLHVAASILFPHCRMATAPGRFTPAAPWTLLSSLLLDDRPSVTLAEGDATEGRLVRVLPNWLAHADAFTSSIQAGATCRTG